MSNINDPKKDENLKDNDALLAKAEQQGEPLDDNDLDEAAGGFMVPVSKKPVHMI